MGLQRTDKERFIHLFGQLGIPLFPDDEYVGSNPDNLIIKESSGSDKVEGYGGFYVRLEFTPEGKFIKMGIWE